MANENFLILVPLLLILAVATILDWREHRIPNTLTFGAALFGLILQGSVSGVPGLALGAAGGVICLVFFLPFYATGGMAAGDVKLMAAVGAFIGPIYGIAACFFTLIAGGVIGLVSLVLMWNSHATANVGADRPQCCVPAFRMPER
jgi:prepilin peptidase CpaA